VDRGEKRSRCWERTPPRKIRDQFCECKHTSLSRGNLAHDRTYHRLTEVISNRVWRCVVTMRDPGLAAVLSAIIPGVGQFYNGRVLAGILWLIITPGLWIGTGGLLGWVCHVIAAYTAYSYARDHPVRISAA
jgi:TM2 domain-containing membrane protein YozV